MRLRRPAMVAFAALLAACAGTPGSDRDELLGGPNASGTDPGAPRSSAQNHTYSEGEIAEAVEDWLGVSAETAGSIVERIFSDLGRPNGYIYGGEAAGAIGVGLRYGQGTLITKAGEQREVYWQGPSVGWDAGGNASKSFTLVYNLPDPDNIYRRFPGVEGTAYFIGGVGVNYQRAENVTLAPMRAGVGLRAGANIGYLAYSRNRRLLPF